MEKGGGEESEEAKMKRLKSLFVGSAWKNEDEVKKSERGKGGGNFGIHVCWKRLIH